MEGGNRAGGGLRLARLSLGAGGQHREHFPAIKGVELVSVCLRDIQNNEAVRNAGKNWALALLARADIGAQFDENLVRIHFPAAVQLAINQLPIGCNIGGTPWGYST